MLVDTTPFSGRWVGDFTRNKALQEIWIWTHRFIRRQFGLSVCPVNNDVGYSLQHPRKTSFDTSLCTTRCRTCQTLSDMGFYQTWSLVLIPTVPLVDNSHCPLRGLHCLAYWSNVNDMDPESNNDNFLVVGSSTYIADRGVTIIEVWFGSWLELQSSMSIVNINKVFFPQRKGNSASRVEMFFSFDVHFRFNNWPTVMTPYSVKAPCALSGFHCSRD